MKNNIEIVIEPGKSWLRVPWREIVEYRDLLSAHNKSEKLQGKCGFTTQHEE